MQIKTTKRYDLTSVTISVTKKINNNWSLFGCREQGTFAHYCWENWLVLALWDNYRSSFKNRTRMTTWSSYSIFESLVSGNEIWMIKKIPQFRCLMLHYSLFTELRYFTQVHLWLNEWRTCGIYWIEYYSHVDKWHPIISIEMYGTGRHYAKLQTER